MQNDQIFRQQALKRIASPDQLDRLVSITSPLGWVALLGLALVVVSAVVWSFAGSLPVTASGQGVLLPSSGLAAVTTLERGQITELAVVEQQTVTAGQTVATIRTATGSQTIAAPVGGTVADVLVERWSPVDSGTVLMRIVPPNGTLLAEAFIDPEWGQTIRPGMPVSLAPLTANQETSGFLLGTVSSVAPLPSSLESIMQRLGNDVLAREVSGNGRTLRVSITLTPDPATSSGLKWSTSRGAPLAPAIGTVTGVSIQLGAQRPIGLLIPSLGYR